MKNESGNIMTQSVSLNDFAVWCILDSRVTSYELIFIIDAWHCVTCCIYGKLEWLV